LAPDTLDGPEIEAAMFAAEAQVEILRVRRAKVDLVNRAANHLRDEDARALPPCERATMGFAQKSKTLVAFDRYERRALSRRNRRCGGCGRCSGSRRSVARRVPMRWGRRGQKISPA
jgi:hypothetical protein